MQMALWMALAVAVGGDAAGDGWVEGKGEAQVTQAGVVAAKQAATAAALRRCVEQVVGITIQSEFSSSQRETVKNNQSAFDANVQEKLLQRSEGFVEKYELVGERRQGEVLEVTVRARVFESKLRAEVKKLGDLLQAAGNPKLMLVIQEVVLTVDGRREPSSDSLLGANIEKELLARGFELRGQAKAREWATGGATQLGTLVDDAAKLAEVARAEGADIVISGRVEITDKGVIEDAGGLDALKGQRRVEISTVLRGTNAATGEVLSAKPWQMASVGTNVERAVHRALKGRGNNLVDQVFGGLLDDLKTSFQKTAREGQSFVVRLQGVRSFRKEGKGFMDLLGKVAGVAGVKQRSFASGTLEIDVACRCSADELQTRIFSAAEGDGSLDGIDMLGVSGKQLSFKL